MRSPGRLTGGASQQIPSRIREAIEPVIGASELDLLGVELSQEGRRAILWVFIDHPDGVTIDDCARVSPEISAALDVDDPLADAYELRVSSPGLDRPLFCEADFEQFQGQEVQIQLSTALNGRRKFTGKIGEMEDDQVRLICADGEHLIPLSSIHRARLRYELSIGGSRGPREK
ncbi:ribosome maturation factor RimP [Myxococcota bacterium]|nr:ribosome maturation factor RimP [Myxococcota bacterium]MBU1433192.1 ribosome maturation factor RimP [Myxococcota bacterium]MBU1900181.1 ribosome maturation factor RimP [Myxococcota bacterium]